VLWRVISADGHPVSGGFSFGVGVPAGTTPSRVPPDALVGGLHALAWWAAYLGAVILLGVPFFALVVRPDDVREPRLHRLVRAGWQVSLASAVVLLLLQGAYGGGLGLGHVAGLDLLQQTLTGRAGLLLLLRLFVLGLAVAAGPWPGTESLGGLRRNAAGLAMLFLPTFSLLGHSGEGPLAPLAVISDSAHLAAAGVWLGGAAALLAAPPATTATASHGAARWSGVAMLAVAVLAATGTFQAWREVPAFGALPATGYGRLLLAKLAVVAVLLGLGDQGRRWLRRAGSARAWSVRRFRAVLTVELAAGATVLALTGALAGAAPASQTFDAPFSATVTARDAEGRPITLRLGVSPTRAGRQTVRLSAADAGGHARPVAAATGSLVEPARGIGPIRFAFAPDAAGRPGSQVVVVPGAGRWSLTVQVQTDPATSYSATLSYDVR
jgi:copper transport protein